MFVTSKRDKAFKRLAQLVGASPLQGEGRIHLRRVWVGAWVDPLEDLVGLKFDRDFYFVCVIDEIARCDIDVACGAC